MITITNLDQVRQDSHATADALQNLQTQINAQPSLKSQTQATVGAAGSASALPATPALYAEIVINGTTYVYPVFAKE